MKNFYHRHSIRLKEYDYSNLGYYHITLCINNRENLLGNIENNKMKLSLIGSIIETEWLSLLHRYKNITLDEYVIMPNHIHGIIVIENKSNVNLGNIICSYKSITMHKCKKKNNTKNKIWQRNYYEHIIRNDKELYETQKYIRENPLKWSSDKLYVN